MSNLITLLGTNFQPEICRWTNSYRVLHFEQLKESSRHKFNRSCALVGLISYKKFQSEYVHFEPYPTWLIEPKCGSDKANQTLYSPRSKHGLRTGRGLLCGCAALMLLIVLMKSIAVHHSSFKLYVIGMRMKASLKGVIFKKVSLLSNA